MYFPPGTDQMICKYFSDIWGKKRSITLYFFNVNLKSDPFVWNSLSLNVEEDRSSCFFGLSRFMLNFPSRSLVGYRALLRTPLSSVHHIWLDCCSGNRCNVASEFIMIKWGEKKIEQKSTFLFQHATWKLKLSHIRSLYFRVFFSNRTQICLASQE